MYGMEKKFHPGWKCQERDGEETSEDTATAVKKNSQNIHNGCSDLNKNQSCYWFSRLIFVCNACICRHTSLALWTLKNWSSLSKEFLSFKYRSPWSTWMLWWSFRVFLIFLILSETLNKSSFILWRLRTMNWDDEETDITWF